jgi:uncharacterized protein (DUF362 family)
MKTSMDRRSFFQNTSSGIIGMGMASFLSVFPENSFGAPQKSRVISVRNERAVSNRNVCDEKEVGIMLDNALRALTGKKKPRQVWTALGLKPNDVVAIKLNCNGAAFPLYTHPELVNVLCASLSSIVPSNNIILYERYGKELDRAGFKINKGSTGVRCMGLDDGMGFSTEEGLTKIITNLCTKLINVCSLKVHDETEFMTTLFLKNHIGSLIPDNMSKCHGNIHVLAEIHNKSSIKNKTVLNLCDGLRATYRPGTPWFWSGILASRDPVAAEYTALQIINNKRKEEGAAQFAIPSYVLAAEKEFNLGTCDPERIEEKNLKL